MAERDIMKIIYIRSYCQISLIVFNLQRSFSNLMYCSLTSCVPLVHVAVKKCMTLNNVIFPLQQGKGNEELGIIQRE